MTTFDRKKDPTACIGDDTRRGIAGASIVEHNGKQFIASTNGRVLSMVRCEAEDGDRPQGVYPGAAFAAARKAGPKHKPASVVLNGSAVVTGEGVQSWPPLADRFPDIDALLRGIPPSTVDVTLDADLLRQLAKGLGDAVVTLRIVVAKGKATGDPIRVDPVYTAKGKAVAASDGSFGLIMPCNY